MIVKASIFLILVSLCVPLGAWAQSSGSPAKSLDSFNLQDIADDSIVMLSMEESGVPGYVHAKYAYIHSACPEVQLVDYYGPKFDANDRTVRLNERTRCRAAYEDSEDDD